MKEETPARKLSFLDRVLFFLNAIAATSLLFSHLASYVSPNTAWWLALFGLGFGTIALVNMAFLIYWLIRRNRRFLLSLLVLVLASGKLAGIYSIRLSEVKAPDNSLRILSFNVRLFDLYNWYHNQETRSDIFKMLREESPDIACFQEYFTSESSEYDYDNKDTLRKVLSAPYSHIHYSLSLHNNKDHWGMATYSRYPIIRKSVVELDSSRKKAFLCTDVVRGKDTLRIINVHLESIGFRSQDYKFLERLGEKEQEELQGAMNIVRRLRRAFIRRSEQAERLRHEIRASPHPVIVCGDFNDTPSSYSYRTVTDGLKDAFRESGSGSGRTYIGIFPSFRIDYILHSEALESYDFRRVDKKLSDHYALTCRVHIPARP